MLSATWRDWYHFRHQQACFASGVFFAAYVSRVLDVFHDDFINPAPAGTLGDGGCDGLAESGDLFYACYGQRPGRDAERELAAKIARDFERGASAWPDFTRWNFVTNAPVGPLATQAITTLQRAHGAEAERPLTVRLVTSEAFWRDVAGTLDANLLDELFPGAPGIRHVELQDIQPLLESLGGGSIAVDEGGRVSPVPVEKMDFNDIPGPSRQEFNAGRIVATRIDRWYEGVSNPDLRDAHGERFRAIYRGARAVTKEPAEIIERLYVALAGENFRLDGVRANAAFAVVSYFFDSCHIFEAPTSVDAAAEAGGEDAAAH